jgi:hypothetical protein
MLPTKFQFIWLRMWKVNGRRTPSDGKSSHCLWQGELKMKITYMLRKSKYITCVRKHRPNKVTLIHQTEEKKWQINVDLEMSDLRSWWLSIHHDEKLCFFCTMKIWHLKVYINLSFFLFCLMYKCYLVRTMFPYNNFKASTDWFDIWPNVDLLIFLNHERKLFSVKRMPKEPS